MQPRPVPPVPGGSCDRDGRDGRCMGLTYSRKTGSNSAPGRNGVTTPLKITNSVATRTRSSKSVLNWDPAGQTVRPGPPHRAWGTAADAGVSAKDHRPAGDILRPPRGFAPPCVIARPRVEPAVRAPEALAGLQRHGDRHRGARGNIQIGHRHPDSGADRGCG